MNGIPKEMLRTGLWPASYIKLFELRYFIKEMDFRFITDLASIVDDHLPWSVETPPTMWLETCKCLTPSISSLGRVKPGSLLHNFLL